VWQRPVARAVAWSLAGSVVACGLLIVAVLWATRRAATDRAIAQARQLGELDARVLFGPYVTDALLAGDRAAFDAFDKVARPYISSGPAVRVKVWSQDEVIVYSDEARLVSQHFPLEDADRELFRTGGSFADLSSLNNAENAFERVDGKLLQVYVGVRTASGRPGLVETYYTSKLVDDVARQLRARFTPVVLAGLIVLTLTQVPLAVALSLRLRRNQRERERLLADVVARSDIERRRIAAEVHDGAVQDLIGVGFSVAGAAEEAPASLAPRLRRVSEGINDTVRQLRSLLGSVYPVHVPPEGLVAGIESFADELRAEGISVELLTSGPLALSPTDEVLVLRAARELLRNVELHGNASHVVVELARTREHATLVVRDDGVGFDAQQLDDRRRRGHLGLRLLEDLATEAGGSFMISTMAEGSTREGGTVARFSLPAGS
jgi:two-component system, NarL family, sensor kinase